MRIIKYYDKINSKLIDIEIEDNIAKFMAASDKRMRRQQAQYNYYTISLDTPVYENDGDVVTLEETIPAKQEKDIVDKDRLKVYIALWKCVDKLEVKEQELIKELFVNNIEQKDLAKKWDVSTSAISQMKNTCILHLHYYLCLDNDFMQTKFYIRHKEEFDGDVNKVAKEIDEPTGLKINLNDVYELTKSNTQFLKMVSSLGIDLDENTKNLFSFMNRTVKNALKDLLPKSGEKSILTIPVDFLKTKEEKISEIKTKSK